MNTEEQMKIYLTQSVVLANYAKLCIQLNLVPELSVIETIENCEDLKRLKESLSIIKSELKS